MQEAPIAGLLGRLTKRFLGSADPGIMGRVLAFAAVALSACSTVGYDGSVSDHFDGERFHNPNGIESPGLGLALRWFVNRDQGYWPDWIEGSPGDPPPEGVGGGHLRVTFVNHATALVQMDGLNVLVDPVWSEVVGPGGIGNRRHRPPGIRFEDLPPIDVVLISHDHYDHLDMPTIERLAAVHRPHFVGALGVGRYLESQGIERAHERDWWDHKTFGSVKVHVVPAQHFAMRGLRDANRRLWAGFVIEGPSGNVFYAGDTGYSTQFSEVRERFGPMRLALLPVGAFRPRWMMCGVHMDPGEAAQAFRDLEAAYAVPVHWGTFAMADDGYLEPVDALHVALRSDERRRFFPLAHGEGWDVPVE